MNENYEQNLRKLREWWQERPDTGCESGRSLQMLRKEITSRMGLLPTFVAEERYVAFLPRLNVVEEDDAYFVSAEVPGVESDSISVSVGPADVTVSGERHAASTEGKRVFAEQLSGEFSRKLVLDKKLDKAAATTELSNGILHIRLPKQGIAASDRCEVKIGEA